MGRTGMLAVVLAVGLTGCSGEPATEPVAASPSPSPSPTGSPSLSPIASPSPSPSSSATPTAPATTPPVPTPSTGTPTVEPAPEATAAPAPAATAAPEQATLPQGLTEVAHGDQVHAAYVAVMESREDPRWAQARQQLQDLGYVASGGELACDSGAAETLGLDPQMLGVAVYFRTAADAQAFAQGYEPGVVGTAPVTLFCLD